METFHLAFTFSKNCLFESFSLCHFSFFSFHPHSLFYFDNSLLLFTEMSAFFLNNVLLFVSRNNIFMGQLGGKHFSLISWFYTSPYI